MKKSFVVCFLASLMMLLPLTSCNEEADHSADQRITEQLPGQWTYSTSQTSEDGLQVSARTTNFTFMSSRFEVTVERSQLSKVTTFSISGTWNIKNETLQLYYNLESLVTSGMTKDEERALWSQFNSNNKMLDDLRDSKQAYGLRIEISRPSAYSGNLKLTGSDYFEGTYTLSGGVNP